MARLKSKIEDLFSSTSRAVLFIIFSCFVTSFTHTSIAQTITPSSISLKDGWEYRWGDPAISKQPISSWLESNEWKTHRDFPEPVPFRNGEKNLWMRVRLPDTLPARPALQLTGVDQNLEIYLDQQIIYSFGEFDEQGQGVFSGYPWHIIPLPENAAGRLLHFRIWADHVNIGLIGRVNIGEGHEVINTMVRRNTSSIVVAIILLFLGILGSFLGIYVRKLEYAFFGVTALSAGVYIFARSQIKQMIWDVPLTWTFIELAAMYVFAPALVGLMANILGKRTWRLVWLCFYLSAGYAVLAIPAAIMGMVPLFATLLPFQLLILVIIPVLLACLIANSTSGSGEARVLMLAIACLLFASFIDILISTGVFMTSLQGESVFFPLGNLVMIMVIGIILVTRAMNVFQKVVVSERTIAALNADLQRNIEHLRELDRLKDDFLSNTSHELRTPLHGIIGVADSLVAGAAGVISDSVRKNLELIIYSGRRLVNLVNDILDFSKLKHNDLEVSMKPLNLNSMIELVFAMSYPLIGKKNIELINDVPIDFTPALADESRLQQILSNLVGNAIKFTQEGFVRINAAYNEEYIRIAITDTGIGIDADKLDIIFESFQQADGSISREFGGTGLGLAITKNLVEAHGGCIGVDSTPGQGSVFWFQLAKAETHEKPVNNLEQCSAEADCLGMRLVESTVTNVSFDAEKSTAMVTISETNDSISRGRILIVDDETVNLQVQWH